MEGVGKFPRKMEMIFFQSLYPLETILSKIKFYSLELSAESKMAAGGHIGKMNYLRITNDTIFNGFLGQGMR